MPNNHISRIQVIKKEALTFKTKITVHFYHIVLILWLFTIITRVYLIIWSKYQHFGILEKQKTCFTLKVIKFEAYFLRTPPVFFKPREIEKKMFLIHEKWKIRSMFYIPYKNQKNIFQKCFFRHKPQIYPSQRTSLRQNYIFNIELSFLVVEKLYPFL